MDGRQRHQDGALHGAGGMVLLARGRMIMTRSSRVCSGRAALAASSRRIGARALTLAAFLRHGFAGSVRRQLPCLVAATTSGSLDCITQNSRRAVHRSFSRATAPRVAACARGSPRAYAAPLRARVLCAKTPRLRIFAVAAAASAAAVLDCAAPSRFFPAP